MARKRDPEEGGHSLFWLLLGFLCGVMATFGALLLFSGRVTVDGATPSEAPAPIEPPALDGAPPSGGPVVLTSPPEPVEPAAPIQGPVVRPTLPTFRPEPEPAPTPKAAPQQAPTAQPRPATRVQAPSGSAADQMAEDAAASGMTSRTR